MDASLHSNHLLPGEPLFVRIVAASERPTPAAGGQVPVRHWRLRGTLFQAQTVVSEFPLFERRVRLIAEAGRQEGFYVGYLTRTERQGGPELLAKPGRYTLVIRDIERRGIASETLEIVVRQPVGSGGEAWKAYKEAGLQNIAMGLQKGQVTDAGLAVFRDVAARFPGTRYAAYSRAGLVLYEFNRTKRRAATEAEADRDQWRTMLARTDGVGELFEEKHPLRERLLLVRAISQAKAGALDDAQETLNGLKREFQNGELKEEIVQIEAELSKKRGG